MIIGPRAVKVITNGNQYVYFAIARYSLETSGLFFFSFPEFRNHRQHSCEYHFVLELRVFRCCFFFRHIQCAWIEFPQSGTTGVARPETIPSRVVNPTINRPCGIFTCTSVAIVRPKVSAIWMTADGLTLPTYIMLPQPRNKSVAVPRNSENSILHIWFVSDTSSIAIMPCTTETENEQLQMTIGRTTEDTVWGLWFSVGFFFFIPRFTVLCTYAFVFFFFFLDWRYNINTATAVGLKRFERENTAAISFWQTSKFNAYVTSAYATFDDHANY